MKKRMISLIMTLGLSLFFAIPASASEAEAPIISAEQYQHYLEIVQRVSNERGVKITLGDQTDISKAYTDEEFEREVREFCDVVDAIQNPVTVTPYGYGDNPSDGGYGEKYLKVNTAKTIDNKYFLFTITGKAMVTGTNPYSLGNVSIENVEVVKQPDLGYTCKLSSPSRSTTVSKTVKRATRNMTIHKNTDLMATVTIQASFSLATSTGVVTMRGTSYL